MVVGPATARMGRRGLFSCKRLQVGRAECESELGTRLPVNRMRELRDVGVAESLNAAVGTGEFVGKWGDGCGEWEACKGR